MASKASMPELAPYDGPIIELQDVNVTFTRFTLCKTSA